MGCHIAAQQLLCLFLCIAAESSAHVNARMHFIYHTVLPLDCVTKVSKSSIRDHVIVGCESYMSGTCTSTACSARVRSHVALSGSMLESSKLAVACILSP